MCRWHITDRTKAVTRTDLSELGAYAIINDAFSTRCELLAKHPHCIGFHSGLQNIHHFGDFLGKCGVSVNRNRLPIGKDGGTHDMVGMIMGVNNRSNRRIRHFTEGTQYRFSCTSRLCGIHHNGATLTLYQNAVSQSVTDRNVNPSSGILDPRREDSAVLL